MIEKKKTQKITDQLDQNEAIMLSKLGNLTLEALIIHSLSIIYSDCKSKVHTIRAAALIQRLTQSLNMNASTLSKEKGNNRSKCY